jgi:hypothetical protein
MVMKPLPDYTGQQFGRLKVLRYFGVVKRYRSYECQCSCGKLAIVSGSGLHAGQQSCGCLQIEAATSTLRGIHKAQWRHGMTGTITYVCWLAMMDRCFDRHTEQFTRYGAKGITACQYLRESPLNLRAMVGDRPSRKYSLDRISSTGSYTCGTCPECKEKQWPLNIKWSTFKEQACNRKNNVWLTIDGETLTRSQWAEKLGISYRKACSQLRKYEMKKVEFQPPKGAVPEGHEAGEDFDMVCTFRVKDNGSCCLVVMGETKMPGYDDKAKPADYREYSKGMMADGDRMSDKMTMAQDGQ